jgi:hypothetical protein
MGWLTPDLIAYAGCGGRPEHRKRAGHYAGNTPSEAASADLQSAASFSKQLLQDSAARAACWVGRCGYWTADCLVYFLQAQKESPADFANCKDKFLVQVKGLDAGEVRQQLALLPAS